MDAARPAEVALESAVETEVELCEVAVDRDVISFVLLSVLLFVVETEVETEDTTVETDVIFVVLERTLELTVETAVESEVILLAFSETDVDMSAGMSRLETAVDSEVI